MQYVGSKNRLSKELAPIIQGFINESTEAYIEPFVGGANMIDKIDHKNKKGYDIHRELISLLNHVKDSQNMLPDTITEDVYLDVKENRHKHQDWYVGLVGFCASYGSMFFKAYSGNVKDHRDRPAEAIRNIEKQRGKLQDIEFINKPYDLIPSWTKNAVIYCDPPYKGTIKYDTDEFDYDKFYKWCKTMSTHNTVLVSEYDMPEDQFECIWSKEHKVLISSKRKSNSSKNIRVEKLFIVKNELSNSNT